MNIQQKNYSLQEQYQRYFANIQQQQQRLREIQKQLSEVSPASQVLSPARVDIMV